MRMFCVGVQGKHPGHRGKSDIKDLESEDQVAVLLSRIPDVDELVKTVQFKQDFPGLLKHVSFDALPLPSPFAA